MRKKLMVFFICAAMTASFITGCAGSTGGSSTTSEESSAAVDDNVVYGRVTAVNVKEITYEILTRDENSVPKEMPEGSFRPDAGERGEKAEKMPEGSFRPDAGEKGEKPADAPDGRGMAGGFSSTGETATVTVEDNVTVQSAGRDKAAETASIDDITEGTIIELTYTGESLSTITVYLNDGRGGNKDNMDSAATA